MDSNVPEVDVRPRGFVRQGPPSGGRSPVPKSKPRKSQTQQRIPYYGELDAADPRRRKFDSKALKFHHDHPTASPNQVGRVYRTIANQIRIMPPPVGDIHAVFVSFAQLDVNAPVELPVKEFMKLQKKVRAARRVGQPLPAVVQYADGRVVRENVTFPLPSSRGPGRPRKDIDSLIQEIRLAEPTIKIRGLQRRLLERGVKVSRATISARLRSY